MTAEQTQHQQAASTNRTLHASVNHGRPNVAASVRPGQMGGRGGVESGRPSSPDPLRESEGNKPASEWRTQQRDRPPSLRPPNAAPANAALDERHLQELDRLHQQQTEERQRIEQKHRQDQHTNITYSCRRGSTRALRETRFAIRRTIPRHRSSAPTTALSISRISVTLYSVWNLTRTYGDAPLLRPIPMVHWRMQRTACSPMR